ncbi:MAG: hypothetical protein Kow0069_13810 [Promethearchaeota archaeon]
MGEYAVVAGGGKFGAKAVEHLLSVGLKVLLVDPVASKWGKGVRLVRERAEDWLPRLLEMERPPTHVVPAVPFNLAAKLLVRTAEREGLVAITGNGEGNGDLVQLALCVRSRDEAFSTDLDEGSGTLCLSRAPVGATCPSNCPGKLDWCVHEGDTPRRRPLFQLVRECASSVLPRGVRPWVFESEQLAPGVGGVSWAELGPFLEWLLELRALKLTAEVLVGTACNCHGVFHRVSLRPP